MKFSNALTFALAATSSVNALSIPDTEDSASLVLRDVQRVAQSFEEYHPAPELSKRKGGGGGGGGGRGGGGGGGGGKGGSGGGGRTSSSSNVGGQTRSGTGTPRAYGNGGYYGGGAAIPYQSSARSPKGILGVFIGGAALSALFVGTFAYGAYMYPYGSRYTFRNVSAGQNGTTTLPVKCICAAFLSCGCDENTDQTYINSLVGDGDYNKLNKTLVQVTEPNGTRTLAINGTLANGTTAPGGVDDAGGRNAPLEQAGLLILGAAMSYALLA
ncbi:hypothetical protein EJ05DRAFT_537894 [Pseudovirgaria hyperparasitica]|uniref:DUF7732 domain-containing protein n=1 Tax=Pseudovirgaria hyperparasitica TaxID=470096 RepID=A0A6A6W7M3_9PEZI|nr:uncharacterized protein EJ05DRAFT_537894 [Pseudovirgaria hyperparasitica]KAF2758545.1 hypothetical protein EJ05DRAFT_537894 [Pseudovirgaria hyperparasitica]